MSHRQPFPEAPSTFTMPTFSDPTPSLVGYPGAPVPPLIPTYTPLERGHEAVVRPTLFADAVIDLRDAAAEKKGRDPVQPPPIKGRYTNTTSDVEVRRVAKMHVTPVIADGAKSPLAVNEQSMDPAIKRKPGKPNKTA